MAFSYFPNKYVFFCAVMYLYGVAYYTYKVATYMLLHLYARDIPVRMYVIYAQQNE